MINTRFNYFPAFNAGASWQAASAVQGLPTAPINTAAPVNSQVDDFTASPELAAMAPSGPQVLQQFGGDRLKAVTTALAASGGKAPQNPEVPWYGKLLMPFIGGKKKTVSKDLGPDQTVTTRFKIKKFKLNDVRLTTRAQNEDGSQTLRHVDFGNTRPSTGKRGQVKDVGEIIAKGDVKRMFEQKVIKPADGQPGEIANTYFDPKTGQAFLKTTEISTRQGTDKFQTVRSSKNKQTYREIEVLGQDGKATGRYIFDYSQKRPVHQTLNADGQVTRSTTLSKKTDFFKTVDLLSKQPPSSKAPTIPAAAATPATPAVGAPAKAAAGAATSRELALA